VELAVGLRQRIVHDERAGLEVDSDQRSFRLTPRAYREG
jgi:hypothetical protein